MDVGVAKMILLFTFAATFSMLFNSCYCLNASLAGFDADGWQQARATWYGSANGEGTSGGACGYGSRVAQAPFSKLVSAGGPSLYKSGSGCGACYEVRCTANSACSGGPVRVVIIDECPGCVNEAVHFDLSGTAFGAMAKSGQADPLRNVGSLPIEYRRVACNYGGKKITFQVDAGSNHFYFASVIIFENGDGDLSSVELKQAGSNSWLAMKHSWGATWALNYGSGFKAPLSIRLTTLASRRTLEADAVIPVNWVAGGTYTSAVNF